MLDTAAYFERIGYSGSIIPDARTLRAIHRAHLLAVPFENLDIDLGRKIAVDENQFVRKVVERRRGGFCYELNGAFGCLLRGIGFQVTLLSVGVMRDDGSQGPEFDHLALRVDLEEPWLADVGFGDSFLEPLRLKTEIEQPDPVGLFRFTKVGDRLELERRTPDQRWKKQYSFTLRSRRLEDFAAMCHYHQTSPDSHFTQSRICSLALPDGRVTLSGMKLIAKRDARREERVMASEKDYLDALREWFQITL